MSSPSFDWFQIRSGIPALVTGLAVPEKGTVTPTEGEVGFAAGVTDLAEKFGITLACPLRMLQERVGGGVDVLTHESLGLFDGLVSDFSDVDTLGREAGDLEKLGIGLIVSPTHVEDITDLDFDFLVRFHG